MSGLRFIARLFQTIRIDQRVLRREQAQKGSSACNGLSCIFYPSIAEQKNHRTRDGVLKQPCDTALAITLYIGNFEIFLIKEAAGIRLKIGQVI
jgi:hypothetical protein